METTLNYGLERVWFLCQMRGSNDVAIGYDEGSVMIKVCVETVSMVFVAMTTVTMTAGSRGTGYEHGQQWEDSLGQTF